MDNNKYKNLFNNLNLSIPTLNFQKYYESTDSFKALQATLKSFQQQMLPTKLMMDQLTESYRAMLEPIAQITGNYQNLIQPLFESEEFKQAIASWSSIPLSNVEHPEYSVEEMLTEENTTEIFEQLSQNVEISEIAEVMESKTKIDKNNWIKLIKAIIELITAIFLFLSASNVDIDIIFNNNQITINDSSFDTQINENSSNQSDNFTEKIR